MRRILLKLGGRAFDSSLTFSELGQAIMNFQNSQFIIVHGGGSEISQALKDAGRQTRFIDGIRVTEQEDIAIVEQVLSRTINPRICEHLTKEGLKCTPMSGAVHGTLIAEPIKRGGHDYGHVGQIKRVNPYFILDAIRHKRVPVVSPISADEHCKRYNVNADSAASALASGAKCTDLIFFTDVPGVQHDGERVPVLSREKANDLIAQGVIKDGMVAKMESAFAALDGNVKRVHITCWQGPNTLQDLFSPQHPAGTIIQEQED